MPRIRYIKPEFFSDSKLLTLPPICRVLFAGLWVWADRAGRLEDSPLDLKIRILPMDDCNVEALLQALADRGRIIRYESGGRRLLEIPNFSKHQNVHKDERPSKLPPAPPLSPDKPRLNPIELEQELELEREQERELEQGQRPSPPPRGGGAAQDPAIAEAVATGHGLKAATSGRPAPETAPVTAPGSRSRGPGKGKGAGFSGDGLSECGVLAFKALEACRLVHLKKPELVEIWTEAYPGIDLAAEIRACDAWAVAKGKRYKSYDRTLTSWLEKRRTGGGFRAPAPRNGGALPQKGKYDAL